MGLIEDIRSAAIGDGLAIQTSYATVALCYADYTASGRALTPVETFIQQALPLYGNTHSSASASGAATDSLREQARATIAKACNASSEDVVIFCGSGATGAIDRLLRCMDLKRSCDKSFWTPGHFRNDKPVAFIGPYEHMSVDLAIKESFCDVVQIEACQDGLIDLDDLARQLHKHRNRKLKIGAFSAASNVTGILSDVPRIAEMLHDFGALAFFDYAAAAPYCRIDMNPVAEPLCYLDAAFISCHKFPGGPGASGVLVAKKRLFQNKVPAVPGGGTVSYADQRKHVYLPGIAAREEGGTPNILGDIRAGLVFQLKEAVEASATPADGLANGDLVQISVACIMAPCTQPHGVVTDARVQTENRDAIQHAPSAIFPDGRYEPAETIQRVKVKYTSGGTGEDWMNVAGLTLLERGKRSAIQAHEVELSKRVIAALSADPNIVILGNTDVDRLPTISFMVQCGKLALHHNLVTVLLNDLFGIQARGGLSCAGPYGHRLLGIDPATAAKIEALVARDEDGNPIGQGIKPGWCRLSFAYYDSDEKVQYVVEAVKMVAKYGLACLVDYNFDCTTGRWTNRYPSPPLPKLDLFNPPQSAATLPESVFADQLAAATQVISGAAERAAQNPPEQEDPPPGFSEMRWFWLPSEAAKALQS